MPDIGGEIIVQTEKLDGQLKISIHDNGRGIPASVKPMVFIQEFTHGKPRGSGLGLSHARACVEKWQGTIDLESTKGSGTTVTILLPLAEENSRFIAASPLAAPDVNIVLDDEIESYERISSILNGPSIYCASISEFESRRAEAESESGKSPDAIKVGS